MHASIPTTYVSLIFLYILFFSLFFLFFSFSSSFLSVPCSPLPPPLYCSQLPFFILSATVGFTILTPQLLFASYGCPSKTVHWSANYSATTIALNALVAPLFILKQNCLFCFLSLFVFSLPSSG